MNEPHLDLRRPWIWPRGDSHVVLSAGTKDDLGSPDVLKTYVEPGGACSPGIGGVGLTLWVWLAETRRLVCAERLDRAQIRDRWLGGLLPLLRSRWRAGDLEVDYRLAADSHGDRYATHVTLVARLTNRGERPVTARAWLVARGLGPASGPVHEIAVLDSGRRVVADGRLVLLAGSDADVAGAASPEQDGSEISELLLRGTEPTQPRATDAGGWAGAALGYDLALRPGGVWEMGWDAPVWLPGTEPPVSLALRCALPAAMRLEALADRWRSQRGALTIDAPDPRYQELVGAALTQVQMAWHGDEPRVGTLDLPLLNPRGGVSVALLLDRCGQHDLARQALRSLYRQPAGGGRGPQADLPGQLLWATAEHVALSSDASLLDTDWDGLAALAELLVTARSTDTAIHHAAPFLDDDARLDPTAEQFCGPARHGLIQGRALGDRPVYWVNAWALAGLRAAAELGDHCGDDERAAAWRAAAADLARVLNGPRAAFGRHALDFACALWPCDARHMDDIATREEFDRRWFAKWIRGSTYQRADRDRWLEVLEAHNQLRLGHADRALLTVEKFLAHQDAPGLYAWAEHRGPDSGADLWARLHSRWPAHEQQRGQALPAVQVAASLALLVRDLFAWEDDDELILGAGIDAQWVAGCDEEGLGVEALPTRWGPLSWRLRAIGPGRLSLQIRCGRGGPPGGYRLRLPLGPQALVEIEGVGLRDEGGSWLLPGGETIQAAITLS